MRKLRDDEKSEVKKMLESKGFTIMQGLAQEYKVDVMNEMLTLPLGDEVTIAKLTGKQNYLKGIAEFLQTVKTSTSGVGKKKD